jgi:membrane protease YdiL (CAAX protease family)
MSNFRVYLALAAYPLIGIFVFDWWNCGWASEHHLIILPPDVKRKREDAGRHLILAKYALLLVTLRLLVGPDVWRIVPIPTHWPSWGSSVATGIACGALMLVVQHFLFSLRPGAALMHRNEYFLHGSVGLWLAILSAGGFAEEFWRALCIASFAQDNHSALLANLMTAIAFALARQSGLPSRAAPGLANAGAEVVMGLVLGALFIWSRSLATPCLANLIYYTGDFAFAQRFRSTNGPNDEATPDS